MANPKLINHENQRRDAPPLSFIQQITKLLLLPSSFTLSPCFAEEWSAGHAVKLSRL